MSCVAEGVMKLRLRSNRGEGLWKEELDNSFKDIFISLTLDKRRKGNAAKMRKNKNLMERKSDQIFRKEMRLVYVVVVRNQASVNKINNYLIIFNVS